MKSVSINLLVVSSLLLSAALSCSTPERGEEGSGSFAPAEETLDLYFGDNSATRVDIANYSGAASWSDGDEIAVWYQNGSTGSWATGAVSADSKITISGTGKRAKLAVYPPEAATTYNMAGGSGTYANVTRIRYREEYSLTGKGADFSPAPLIALNDPSRSGLKFYHTGGVIRFKLYGVPAGTKYIRIHSDASPLAGEFPVLIPSGNELNGADLVLNEQQWANLFGAGTWESLFGSTHSQDVYVQVSDSALASETDGISISLPVPQGVYNELTISAYDAAKVSLMTGVYRSATESVTWDCERATGTRLNSQALRSNHPMTLPTTVHALFQVSDTKQVYFASGNVLFIADKSGDNWTNRRWKFADNQWDVYADASNYQDGPNRVIDLFGWGTGNNPWLTSQDYHDYSPFTDWGRHFDEVGDGSDTTDEDIWHTLTDVEWGYLHSGRPKASILWGFCTIADNAGVTHDGLMYLPDEWVLPAGITFRPGARNVYSMDGSYDGDWSVLEENGALFLPSAGRRIGTDFEGSYGHYWSSTTLFTHYTYSLYFSSGSVNPPYLGNALHYGLSVRLYRE